MFAVFLVLLARSAAGQVITEIAVPTAGSGPNGLALGSDGAMWFVEFNTNKVYLQIGRAYFSVLSDRSCHACWCDH